MVAKTTTTETVDPEAIAEVIPEEIIPEEIPGGNFNRVEEITAPTTQETPRPPAIFIFSSSTKTPRVSFLNVTFKLH